VIGEIALTPLHVAVSVPVPGIVLGLIAHDHDARPAELDVVAPSPLALLTVPLGVTYFSEQDTFALVCTVALALPPGGAPFTAVNVTVVAVAGAVAVGDGVGVAVPIVTLSAGCSSMPFGATPVWPWMKSKNATPVSVTVPLMNLKLEVDGVPKSALSAARRARLARLC
jgi:hypothetical protein